MELDEKMTVLGVPMPPENRDWEKARKLRKLTEARILKDAVKASKERYPTIVVPNERNQRLDRDKRFLKSISISGVSYELDPTATPRVSFFRHIGFHTPHGSRSPL
jgi:hypothetical protein